MKQVEVHQTKPEVKSIVFNVLITNVMNHKLAA